MSKDLYAKIWFGVAYAALYSTLVTIAVQGCGESAPAPLPASVADARAITATVEAWTSLTLPLSPRCEQEWGSSLAVVAVPREDLQTCGRVESGSPIVGCYVSGGPTIFVPEGIDLGLRQDIVVHEAVHWLNDCNWSDSDPEHTGELPLWRAGRHVCVWGESDFGCVVANAWSRL